MYFLGFACLVLLLVACLFAWNFFFCLSYLLFTHCFFLPNLWLPEVTAAENKCIASYPKSSNNYHGLSSSLTMGSKILIPK